MRWSVVLKEGVCDQRLRMGARTKTRERRYHALSSYCAYAVCYERMLASYCSYPIAIRDPPTPHTLLPYSILILLIRASHAIPMHHTVDHGLASYTSIIRHLERMSLSPLPLSFFSLGSLALLSLSFLHTLLLLPPSLPPSLLCLSLPPPPFLPPSCSGHADGGGGGGGSRRDMGQA
eukprot:581052-Rhodomonas_salina.1